MRLFSGLSLFAAVGFLLGVTLTSQPTEAQEAGEAAPVQIAEAIPVIESGNGETEGSEAISPGAMGHGNRLRHR